MAESSVAIFSSEGYSDNLKIHVEIISKALFFYFLHVAYFYSDTCTMYITDFFMEMRALSTMQHACSFVKTPCWKYFLAFHVPTLLYNCCTWGSTKAVSDKLDVFHRQQLRSLLGIHYPNRITNIELYRRCQSQPISEEVHRRRMTMLGHVLRLPEDTPPQQAMALYFNPPNTAKPGRPLTTLATQIQQDCVHRQTPLKRSPHLQSLRQKASDRQVWKAFVKNAQ